MYSYNCLLLLSLTTLLFISTLTTATTYNVTAIFAFGDSVADAGNNNGLSTICRCNFPPYGIDFPNRVSSGRFTDGKLPVDFVISDLGIKELLPAYLDPGVSDQELLTGATFASSCAGLDDLTSTMSGVISLPAQLKYFQKAFERIRGLVGVEEAGRIVNNALFVLAAGTNDMVNNYYSLPLRQTYSLSEYHDMLLRNLETTIKRLHSLGAVRLAVMGMPPVGCLPMEATVNSLDPGGHIIKRECRKEHNVDSQAYNAKLQSLISRLDLTLPALKLGYLDVYNPIMDIIHKPTDWGFERTLEGCCGSGSVEMGPLCNAKAQLCPDPSKFLFWDAAHPTEAAYKILSKHFIDEVLPSLCS